MRIYNRKIDKGVDWGDYVSIMRPGPYGNPFVIGVHGDREECLRRFELEALPHIDIEPLRNKNLVCACHPLACHGHIYYRALYGVEYGRRPN